MASDIDENPKWYGKTTTASHIAQSILYMQYPEQVKQIY